MAGENISQSESDSNLSQSVTAPVHLRFVCSNVLQTICRVTNKPKIEPCIRDALCLYKKACMHAKGKVGRVKNTYNCQQSCLVGHIN